MKLYLIRHGETAWNKEGKMQGSKDIPINDNGIKQAYEARNIINLDNIDRCLCSPLTRAKQTAQIIVDGKMEIQYLDDLKERSFGKLEGTVATEDIMKRHWDYKLNDCSYEIESLQDCLQRAKKFLEKLYENYPDENILIVSHGCFIKVLHYTLTGYDENTDFLSFFPKNGVLYEYEITKELVRKRIK